MNLVEYKENALRTESIPENIKVNVSELTLVLEMFAIISNLLDCLKKKIYYNNSKKYDSNFSALLVNLEEKLDSIYEAEKNTNEEKLDINVRIFHGIIGTATEAGELVEALRNYISTGKYDAVNIQEESGAGDIAWYTAILMDALGLSWEQGLINNINKLRIRYPEKYSDLNAEHRNLELERKELENNA